MRRGRKTGLSNIAHVEHVGSPPACGRPLGRFVAFMTGRCARADAGWLSGPHPRAIGPDHQRPSDPITPARRSGPPLIHPNQAKAARPAGAFRRAGSRSRAGLTEDGRREQSRPSPPSPQTQVRQGREGSWAWGQGPQWILMAMSRSWSTHLRAKWIGLRKSTGKTRPAETKTARSVAFCTFGQGRPVGFGEPLHLSVRCSRLRNSAFGRPRGVTVRFSAISFQPFLLPILA
jgi:hypothetical protein